MKNPRFKIGEWVRVYQTVSFEYDNSNRRLPVKSYCALYGQIVGATYRKSGVYSPAGYGSSSYKDPLDYEAPYLSEDKTYLVWKIAIGYTNKPLEAFEEDLVEANLRTSLLHWRYSKNINRFYLEEKKNVKLI